MALSLVSGAGNRIGKAAESAVAVRGLTPTPDDLTTEAERVRQPREPPMERAALDEKIGVFADAVVRARRDAGHHDFPTEVVADRLSAN